MENKIIKKWYRIKIISIVALFEYLAITIYLLAEVFNLYYYCPNRIVNKYSTDGIIDTSSIHINDPLAKDGIMEFFIKILIILAVIFVLYLFFAKKNMELAKSKSERIWKFFKIEQILLIIFILFPVIVYIFDLF